MGKKELVNQYMPCKNPGFPMARKTGEHPFSPENKFFHLPKSAFLQFHNFVSSPYLDNCVCICIYGSVLFFLVFLSKPPIVNSVANEQTTWDRAATKRQNPKGGIKTREKGENLSFGFSFFLWRCSFSNLENWGYKYLQNIYYFKK